MSLYINKNKDWTEAIINSNCDFDKFYEGAEIIENDLSINIENKLNDFDTFYWTSFTMEII